ncbi:PREDICTED: transcription factor IIIB 90 kDa subunit-like [Amphimedon queenslandica]|uniref:B-related factor 1 n=2 Tax=Amphimedon queenslandica TaxID=400682 RepID=A0AAN0IX23_AMPQE|nr:PREDICTED: transcription factor IIIB 90 kDa subunit-like [Amphimedon queenslandica]|eukprot:XP_019849314.1 PREDICTED: transcription factor IIIB 90 kDa subunit-like [Amphimedon queenslandica]
MATATSSSSCPHCGGSEIEKDTARGDAVCVGCGVVLEEDIIVSELTFQEQSSGSLALVGQFVSTESGGGGSKAPSLAGFKYSHGLNKNSREATLQQAKRRLTHLGSQLKLNQHCIDMAFGFFKMALQLNLTRGRKSSIMDTACLYLVCRSEGTPHMLLDFSDVLQINVYSLGRAYLRLSTALHINPPALDPCLYIHRFAHKLELGDKVHDVSMTALRLVARMKRDWIHHGRRPAGLCGAALLVAARLHNFNRSVKQISKIVKLSEATIRKRLDDFQNTPSSCLTIEEFLKIDLEYENDPPCFLEAKKKGKEKQVDKGDGGDEDGDKEDDDSSDDDSGLKRLGFGGIVGMQSVQDIIAKARVSEEILQLSTAGLTDDLSDLVHLVEEEEGNKSSNEEEESISATAGESAVKETEELDLEGIDDEEIEQMLLSEEEVKIKSQLWFAENGDFLKEMEARKERLAAVEAKKEGNKGKRTVHRPKKDRTHQSPAATAGEAIERMLVEKKLSSKINYDVLRDLERERELEMSSDMSSTATRILRETDQFRGHERATSLLSIDTSSSRTGSTRLPSLANRKRNLLTSSLPGSKFQRMSATIKSPQETAPEKDEASLEDLPVIEETGPIQPILEEEEEEEEEGGLGDGDIEELIYDGDPLVNSDCEDSFYD